MTVHPLQNQLLDPPALQAIYYVFCKISNLYRILLIYTPAKIVISNAYVYIYIYILYW